MTAFDFLHWCFKDEGHGLSTLVVLGVLGAMADNLIRTWRRK